ncbi:MAG: Rho termination factor N-terminal domain-containing protein [Planctomycetota bacterium]|jgi:hypothetical protein
MGIRELRKLASSLKVKNYSKLRKPELEAAVAKAQAEAQPVASNPVPPKIDLAKSSDHPHHHLLALSDHEISLAYGRVDKGIARKMRRYVRSHGLIRQAGLRRIVESEANVKAA